MMPFRGVVTDPAGANIAAAKVSATSSQTAVVYSATSNETGLYLIPDVPAGQYAVTVEHPGFRRSVRESVAVTTGATLSLDIKLELGELSQSVTVSGEASLVQSSTSGMDQLIEAKSIANIPLGDRRTMNVI